MCDSGGVTGGGGREGGREEGDLEHQRVESLVTADTCLSSLYSLHTLLAS